MNLNVNNPVDNSPNCGSCQYFVVCREGEPLKKANDGPFDCWKPCGDETEKHRKRRERWGKDEMIIMYELILVSIVWMILREIEYYKVVEDGIRQFRETYNSGKKSEAWFKNVMKKCITWKQNGIFISSYYL